MAGPCISFFASITVKKKKEEEEEGYFILIFFFFLFFFLSLSLTHSLSLDIFAIAENLTSTILDSKMTVEISAAAPLKENLTLMATHACKLELVRSEVKQPGPGEALVHVKATG